MADIGDNIAGDIFDPKDLRPEESQILQSVATGDWVHFDDRHATPKAVIRAAFLRHLMLQLSTNDKAWPIAPGGIRIESKLHDNEGVRITGAHIIGRLDLSDGRSPGGGALPVLALEYCDFDQEILLDHAWLQRLSLEGARFRMIAAKGLRLDGPCNLNDVAPVSIENRPYIAVVDLSGSRIEGDLFLSDSHFIAEKKDDGSYSSCAVFLNSAKITGGFWGNGLRAEGGLDLTDAVIEGTVSLEGGYFDGEKSIALAASSIRCGDLLLRENREKPFTAKGKVHLSGASINGYLRADGAQFINSGDDALVAENIRIEGACLLRDGFRAEGTVWLLGAIIKGDLDASNGQLINPARDAFIASGITIEGACLLSNIRAEGRVSLQGGTIKGSLVADGGQFINPKGEALNAATITLDHDCFLNDDFKAEGLVSLHGASIKGALMADGGQFINPGGYAIIASTITINKDCFLSTGFRAEGTVSLQGATIKGVLIADGGQFLNSGADALVADNMVVEGAFLLRDGFRAEGTVWLQGVTIKGNLDALSGQFINPKGIALNLTNSTIAGDGFFRQTVIQGEMAFWGTHFNQSLVVSVSKNTDAKWILDDATAIRLDDDDGKGWGKGSSLSVDGFSYQFLQINNRALVWQSRKIWLENHIEQKTYPGPQPYEQVARVFTQMGHDAAARQVLMHMISKEALNDLWSRPNGIGPYLLGLPITVLRFLLQTAFYAGFGYGYAPGRALVTVTILILLGWLGVGYANDHGLMALKATPVYSAAAPTSDPSVKAPVLPNPQKVACGDQITPFWYAIDIFIPLVDMGQENQCVPDLVTPPRDPVWLGYRWSLFDTPWLLHTLTAVYSFLGALTTSLLVLTYSGVLRRKLKD